MSRKIDRRGFFLGAALSGAALIMLERPQRVLSAETTLDDLLKKIKADISAIEITRQNRENLQVAELLGLKIERGGRISSDKSKTPIDQRATELIIACEVSSQTMYRRRYTHPVWPKGKSGVTIGIGYDLGYVTKADFDEDWRNYIDSSTLSSLLSACEVKGKPAGALAAILQKATVEWEIAKRQYLEQLQPRYIGLTENSLPNTTLLSAKCLGALVSLVYNRGPSFAVPIAKDKEGRYDEMREIKRLMSSRETIRMIPEQIRSMKRLWIDKKDMGGVVLRREYEATLFEQGLLEMRRS